MFQMQQIDNSVKIDLPNKRNETLVIPSIDKGIIIYAH